MEVVKTQGEKNKVRPLVCDCASMPDEYASVHAPECRCFPADTLKDDLVLNP